MSENEKNAKTMQDQPDSVKRIKKAFAAGCTIAAFMLPILLVSAVFRKSS